MDRKIYDTYVALLKAELTMATGCTEPIAIAYAGAKLREVLGRVPERCTVFCSGNMVKNVFAVTVPNSGGSRGIDTAALLGMVGGDADAALDVLHAITPEQIEQMQQLKAAGVCSCELVEGVANLYIRIEGVAGRDNALVEIKDYHTNITRILKDGEPLYVQLKAAMVQESEGMRLIVGINDVDAQYRQKEINREIARQKEIYDQITVSLAEQYDTLYYIDVATSTYIEISSTDEYKKLNVPATGNDFFAESRRSIRNCDD